MRKTIEAIHAWRRAYQGTFPARLTDLVSSGYLPTSGAICPNVLAENRTADPSHTLASSRGKDGDPNTSYEYELSPKVLKSGFEARWLPPDTSYTRQDLKIELLRRPLNEQVPWLRCHSHRIGAPPEFKKDSWRNATGSGDVYWSGFLWEERWYADVPYCCREANVLFGLKGPPFHSDRTPKINEALNLRSWVCAFGDHPWWWSYPFFDDPPNTQRSATLKAFFRESPGRVAFIDGISWWIDGLCQLQGQISPDEKNMYRQPCAHAFVWERTGLSISRKISRASWLQGTVWSAPPNQTTGWLIWHYSKDQAERVPITYGKTTARFWGDVDQISKEQSFPEPVWRHHESAEEAGKERWLRLYKQSWENPHPELTVTSLDFVSNHESPAAPFIVAINVYP